MLDAMFVWQAFCKMRNFYVPCSINIIYLFHIKKKINAYSISNLGWNNLSLCEIGSMLDLILFWNHFWNLTAWILALIAINEVVKRPYIYLGKLQGCPCFEVQLHVCPWFFNFACLPLFLVFQLQDCPYFIAKLPL